MPPVEIVFYRDDDGSVPVLEWLKLVRKREHRVFAKCYAKIARLAEYGHELHRPDADLLRDGIYELRISFGHVNYRILYFFHERGVSVLAHSLTKEGRVPDGDVQTAVDRKARFGRDPERHRYYEETQE